QRGNKPASWYDWLLNLWLVKARDEDGVRTLLQADLDALPVLRELCEDSTPCVRWAAAFALLDTSQAHPGKLLTLLAEVLLDKEAGNYYMRAECLLEELGPDAEPIIPLMIQALTNHARGGSVSIPPFICDNVLKTLRSIGAPAVPALLKALKDASTDV